MNFIFYENKEATLKYEEVSAVARFLHKFCIKTKVGTSPGFFHAGSKDLKVDGLKSKLPDEIEELLPLWMETTIRLRDLFQEMLNDKS